MSGEVKDFQVALKLDYITCHAGSPNIQWCAAQN